MSPIYAVGLLRKTMFASRIHNNITHLIYITV